MVSDREPPYGPDEISGYFNVPVQTVSSWNRQNLMRRYQVGKHVRYRPEDVYAFDDELLEQMDDGQDRPRGLKNVRWSTALRRAEGSWALPRSRQAFSSMSAPGACSQLCSLPRRGSATTMCGPGISSR